MLSKMAWLYKQTNKNKIGIKLGNFLERGEDV
jgi:hypothetical protein